MGSPAIRNRHLLIQTYVFLVGGLIAVTAVLDFGFNALLDRQSQSEDPWRRSTMQLIESALVQASPEARPALAASLAKASGVGIQLLKQGDVASPAVAGVTAQTLVDARGQSYFLRPSAQLGGMIRFGPLPAPPEPGVLRILPALFYLSILIIVGLWLRPLLRDLRLLTDASQAFAADYRRPLQLLPRMRRLRSLAANLESMSTQLSNLIQNQKELTAALSHEMRTPLARIRFALAVIGNQADESVKSRLQEVNGDVGQIDELISRILEFARLDHPDLRMRWQKVVAADWLRNLLVPYESSLLPIAFNVAAGCERIWLEPRLMELAVSNLLVNARRYARQRVTLTIAAQADRQCILVEDDGEGIAEADRAQVFQAFRRLDTSRNQESHGHGLGLAIVARVAALHGGEVTLDSSAALGGARFRIAWPAQVPHVAGNDEWQHHHDSDEHHPQ